MTGRSRALAAVVVTACLVTTAACSDPAITSAPPASDAATQSPPQTDAPETETATETTPVEALPDGSVAAVGDPHNGGLLYIVWDGTAERIQQPAPMDRATLREIGIRIARPVERFRARPQPDPRTFWVVFPPDGPRARLHLAIADRLHPVVTVPARQSQIDALGRPSVSLLNRMRPAR